MRNYDLLVDLGKARNSELSFHIITKTASEHYDMEKIRKAKELHEDGYINFTICEVVDSDDLGKMVDLKGVFTAEGKRILDENNIKSEMY